MIVSIIAPSLHHLLEWRVRSFFIARRATRLSNGPISSWTTVRWKSRTFVSVSHWRSLNDALFMGEIDAHVRIVHAVQRSGARFQSTVFAASGCWDDQIRLVSHGPTMTTQCPEER